MDNIIKCSLGTLQKSKKLLLSLNSESLSNASISPYYSSIGSHLRHVYDFYNCLLNNGNKGVIDLTIRKRDLSVETCCDSAIGYLDDITLKLKSLKYEANTLVKVIDDLGYGNVEINYTYPALLAQANSHTIHHYAIIGYILDRLNIEFLDDDFGYNPTTPKKTK